MTEPIPIAGVAPAGDWSGEPIDEAWLDYDGRHRRRIVITGTSGAAYLLNLPEAMHLRDGDGLALGGRRYVRVRAKPEELMEVRAASGAELARLAWHIGNRHLAAAIDGERILIRRDHVIGHMMEHLGAVVRNVEAPFDPEGGAYQDDHHHGEDAPHDHDHDH